MLDGTHQQHTRRSGRADDGSVVERFAAGLGQEQEQGRAGQGAEPGGGQSRPQAEARLQEADQLEAAGTAERAGHRPGRLRRGPGSGREELAQPGREHGGRRAGQRAPQNVARPVDRGSAQERGSRPEHGQRAERDRGPPASETVRERTSGREGRYRGQPRDDHHRADQRRAQPQVTAPEEGDEEAGGLEEERAEAGGGGQEQEPATPGGAGQEGEGRAAAVRTRPCPALGQVAGQDRDREQFGARSGYRSVARPTPAPPARVRTETARPRWSAGISSTTRAAAAPVAAVSNATAASLASPSQVGPVATAPASPAAEEPARPTSRSRRRPRRSACMASGRPISEPRDSNEPSSVRAATGIRNSAAMAGKARVEADPSNPTRSTATPVGTSTRTAPKRGHGGRDGARPG